MFSWWARTATGTNDSLSNGKPEMPREVAAHSLAEQRARDNVMKRLFEPDGSQADGTVERTSDIDDGASESGDFDDPIDASGDSGNDQANTAGRAYVLGTYDDNMDTGGGEVAVMTGAEGDEDMAAIKQLEQLEAHDNFDPNTLEEATSPFIEIKQGTKSPQLDTQIGLKNSIGEPTLDLKCTNYNDEIIIMPNGMDINVRDGPATPNSEQLRKASKGDSIMPESFFQHPNGKNDVPIEDSKRHTTAEGEDSASLEDDEEDARVSGDGDSLTDQSHSRKSPSLDAGSIRIMYSETSNVTESNSGSQDDVPLMSRMQKHSSQDDCGVSSDGPQDGSNEDESNEEDTLMEAHDRNDGVEEDAQTFDWKLPDYECILDNSDGLPALKISIPGLVRETVLLHPDYATDEQTLFKHVFIPTQQAYFSAGEPNPEPRLSAINFHTIAVLVLDAVFAIGIEHSEDELWLQMLDTYRVGMAVSTKKYEMIRELRELWEVGNEIISYLKEHGVNGINKQLSKKRRKKENNVTTVQARKKIKAGPKDKIATPRKREKPKTNAAGQVLNKDGSLRRPMGRPKGSKVKKAKTTHSGQK